MLTVHVFSAFSAPGDPQNEQVPRGYIRHDYFIVIHHLISWFMMSLDVPKNAQKLHTSKCVADKQTCTD